MSFLRRCEEMEQSVEEGFTKLVRAVMRRKEEILLEIQSVKTAYLQTKERMDRQREQYKLHLPREDLPLDNEVKHALEKVGREIEQKLTELSLREASYEELEVGFCWEEELILRSIEKLGCVLIQNAQPQNKLERTVKLTESPLMIAEDTEDSNYYIIVVDENRIFYGVTFNVNFDVKCKEKLGKITFGKICTNNASIYLSQPDLNVILVYDKRWKFLRKFGIFGISKNEMIRPLDLCSRNSKLYVCDSGNNRIQVFKDEKHTTFIGNYFDCASPVKLLAPMLLHISHQDEMVVSHKGNPCFNVYSLEGSLLRIFGSLISGLMPAISFFTMNTHNEILLIPFEKGSVQIFAENRNVSVRIGNSKTKRNSSWNLGVILDILSLRDNRIVLCDPEKKRLCIFRSDDINLNSIFN